MTFQKINLETFKKPKKYFKKKGKKLNKVEQNENRDRIKTQRNLGSNSASVPY